MCCRASASPVSFCLAWVAASYVGDQLQHEIRDPEFAEAFFAIWLDPRTRDPELRQQLLGLQ